MSDKAPEPVALADGLSHSGRGTELGLVEEAAHTVRRMQADESFNEQGVRTIWHRGRSRVEMLTFEDRDKNIVSQELSIFGMLIEFRQDKPLRTGKIPPSEEASSGGKPMSQLIKMDAICDPKALTYGSHLLKHVKGRDFYQQHLLKQINIAISQLGFDDARTAVASLDSFSRSASSLPTMKVGREGLRKTQIIRPQASSKTWALAAALLVLGVAGGLGVAWLLELL